MQTIRRELRTKFMDLIREEWVDLSTPDGQNALAEALADAALEVRGIALLQTDEVPGQYKPKLPAGSGLDWQIATGAEITQADLDLAALKDTAPKMFEKAFGTGQWPWWSNSVWEKFARFVVEVYSKDKNAFGNYIVWRAGAGKYTGFSNKKIRENPVAFMDTGWPEFEATQQTNTARTMAGEERI